MYEVIITSQFKRDYKKIKKRGLDLKIFDLLSNGEVLPEKYRDHELTGQYKGFRECHLQPDWLLIYFLDKENSILKLATMGSHSDLFE